MPAYCVDILLADFCMKMLCIVLFSALFVLSHFYCHVCTFMTFQYCVLEHLVFEGANTSYLVFIAVVIADFFLA